MAEVVNLGAISLSSSRTPDLIDASVNSVPRLKTGGLTVADVYNFCKFRFQQFAILRMLTDCEVQSHVISIAHLPLEFGHAPCINHC